MTRKEGVKKKPARGIQTKLQRILREPVGQPRIKLDNLLQKARNPTIK